MESSEAGFGSGVVGELGGAEVADYRGDVDDGAAAAAADDGGEEGLEAVEWAEEVGGYAGVDFIER